MSALSLKFARCRTHWARLHDDPRSGNRPAHDDLADFVLGEVPRKCDGWPYSQGVTSPLTPLQARATSSLPRTRSGFVGGGILTPTSGVNPKRP